MADDEIIFTLLPGEQGHVAEIVLNRPKALNALTFSMCEALQKKLLDFEQDPAIKAVVIYGAGERAFCAGGDVRSIYHHRNNISAAMKFFKQEYAMNATLFHFSKPYIALLHGITMGGGAGVSIYGSHRIASESFSWAMPETAIGFYPDIGAGYFLNRCPNKMGYYLGLSGVTINASDALALGLVDAVIPHHAFPAIIQQLCALNFGKNPREKISAMIHAHATTPQTSSLMTHRTEIERYFCKTNVKEIFLMLESNDAPWSQELISILQKRSPTSLVVTLEYLNRSHDLSFDEVMALNLTLTEAFMQHPDFFEGVRAALIDKDQAPLWCPDKITEISDVAEYFTKEGLMY